MVGLPTTTAVADMLVGAPLPGASTRSTARVGHENGAPLRLGHSVPAVDEPRRADPWLEEGHPGLTAA